MNESKDIFVKNDSSPYHVKCYMELIQPDYKQCKTHNRSDHLWDCLVDISLLCPFNIDLGTESLCLHYDCDKYEDAGEK